MTEPCCSLPAVHSYSLLLFLSEALSSKQSNNFICIVELYLKGLVEGGRFILNVMLQLARFPKVAYEFNFWLTGHICLSP